MFPYGKKVCQPVKQLINAGTDLCQSISSSKVPFLTALQPMERLGLVAAPKKGLTFCKEWSAKQMFLFFQQHLPRPFEHFAGAGGFDEELPDSESSLPYFLLSKARQSYSIAPSPEKYSDLTGKFYHDHATGTQGSSYKNRLIVLGEHIQIIIVSH